MMSSVLKMSDRLPVKKESLLKYRLWGRREDEVAGQEICI